MLLLPFFRDIDSGGGRLKAPAAVLLNFMLFKKVPFPAMRHTCPLFGDAAEFDEL